MVWLTLNSGEREARKVADQNNYRLTENNNAPTLTLLPSFGDTTLRILLDCSFQLS